MTLHRPKLSDPAHEDARLQPQRDGRVRCSTRLGINSVSFILFPSPPGIVKAQRRTDGANPCQNRQGRFPEQHNGKNGIDDPPDKVDMPGNLALSVHSCVGARCHSSAPMPPVMSNGRMAGRLRNSECCPTCCDDLPVERRSPYERRTAHQLRSHFDRTSLYASQVNSSSPISGATTERTSF